MPTVDYYSEDVPVAENEPEVLESLPAVQIHTSAGIIDTGDRPDPDYIVEEDAKIRLKSVNTDFELKVKDQLLYSFTNNVATRGFRKPTSDRSLETKRKNRALKFSLLENELRALMVEINNDDDNADLDLKEKVDRLVTDIDDFKLGKSLTFLNYWEEKLDATKSGHDNGINESADKVTNLKDLDFKENNSDVKFLEFESRISKLENGLGFESFEGITPSIHDTMTDLYTRVNLILDGGKTLKPVEDEILKLITNCETYIKDSKRIRDKSEIVPLTDKKLCLLYEKVKALPNFTSFLEKLMERFSSLNQLIAGTSDRINFLQGLEKELFNLESRLDSWDQNLDSHNLQLENDRNKFNETTEMLANYMSKK